MSLIFPKLINGAFMYRYKFGNAFIIADACFHYFKSRKEFLLNAILPAGK